MKGRKPELKAVDGALTKVPTPPKWLTPEAKTEWKRVLPDLVSRRILVPAMLGTVEKYCVMAGQVQIAQRALDARGHFLADEKGKLYRHPALQVLSDAASQARQHAAELGLTPTSRTKTGPASDARDELSDLDL